MNEDDYWIDALSNRVYRSTYDNDWLWTATQDPSLSTQDAYNLLTKIEDYIRKDSDMSWSYNRYNNTRGDEVATAILEAYADGVAFETLIQKNSTVRQYWYTIQSERANKLKKAEQERIRRQKAAEKKKLEDAARAEAAAKLTPEELAAFGLNKKGYHKR